jgi:hypothetical protein
MGNLKMRFRLKDVEFEIEGSEASVKQEFERMKSFVVNELIPGQPYLASSAAEEKQAPSTIDPELPSVETLDGSLQLRTESDWIALFSLYASSEHGNRFTVGNLRDYYRSSGRASTQRVNNIRNNMKTLLNKSMIEQVGENEFGITANGRKYAQQILKGKQPSKFRNAVKSVGRGRRPKMEEAVEKPSFRDMELTEEQLSELTKFFRSKKPRNQAESILVLVKWAQDNLETETIGIDELRYLMHKTMKKAPAALGVILAQMRSGEEPLLANAGRGRLAASETGSTVVDSQLPVRGSRKSKVSKPAGTGRRGRPRASERTAEPEAKEPETVEGNEPEASEITES